MVFKPHAHPRYKGGQEYNQGSIHMEGGDILKVLTKASEEFGATGFMVGISWDQDEVRPNSKGSAGVTARVTTFAKKDAATR